MTPDAIRERNAFPAGLLPMPHPHHEEGGMVFPELHFDEVKRQEGRDLTRFDLDFDLPDHLVPELPVPDLFDDTAGSRRCVARTARHDQQLVPLDPSKATAQERRGDTTPHQTPAWAVSPSRT